MLFQADRKEDNKRLPIASIKLHSTGLNRFLMLLLLLPFARKNTRHINGHKHILSIYMEKTHYVGIDKFTAVFCSK